MNEDKLNNEIKKLKFELSRLKFMNNPNRKEIFELVKKNKHLSITDISKKVNLSYQNTFAHIKKLEEYGLIKRNKQHKTRGRVVFVEWTGKNTEDIINDFLK